MPAHEGGVDDTRLHGVEVRLPATLRTTLTLDRLAFLAPVVRLNHGRIFATGCKNAEIIPLTWVNAEERLPPPFGAVDLSSAR